MSKILSYLKRQAVNLKGRKEPEKLHRAVTEPVPSRLVRARVPLRKFPPPSEVLDEVDRKLTSGKLVA